MNRNSLAVKTAISLLGQIDRQVTAKAGMPLDAEHYEFVTCLAKAALAVLDPGRFTGPSRFDSKGQEPG